jgi:hypothetical protein
VSGCSMPAPAPVETRASETPSADPTAVTIEMPDIGPSPAPDDLDAEELERLRLAEQDANWSSVARQYPTAVRPDVAFAGYTDMGDYIDALDACYVRSGLVLGTMTDEVGTSTRSGVSPDTEEGAVKAFTCRAEVAVEPHPMNAAQLGYLYDYLSRFLAPCYAANGIANPPAPSREDFVAKWPRQNWFPEMGPVFGTPAAAPLIAACPGPYA